MKKILIIAGVAFVAFFLLITYHNHLQRDNITLEHELEKKRQAIHDSRVEWNRTIDRIQYPHRN